MQEIKRNTVMNKDICLYIEADFGWGADNFYQWPQIVAMVFLEDKWVKMFLI